MELSLEEKKLVLAHREKKEKEASLKRKQASCTHPERRYAYHSHNDSAYECILCGDIEWR